MTYAIPALQDRCDSVRIINVGGASNNNSNDAGDNGPGGNNRTGSDRTLIRFRAAQSSRSAFYHPVFGPGVRRRPGYGPLMLADQDQKKPQQTRPQASVSSAGLKRGRASEEALLPRWNFRPSALQYDAYGNGTMSVQQIKELYVQDCERALRQGVRIPQPRKRIGTSSSGSPFRCLQWNIQAFSSPFEERNLHTITPGIIAAILEQEADVLVLNEIAWRDEKEWRHNIHNIHRREDFAVAMEAGEEEYISEQNQEEAAALLQQEDSTIIGLQSKMLLEDALEARGYHFITMTQHGDTPTLIASRLPVHQQHELQLSENRSALCILIDLSGGGAPTSATASVSASARDEEHRDDTNSSHSNTNININININTNSTNTTNKSDNYCWIVGTHLDAFAADQRRQEISTLLQQFEHKNTTTPSIPVVVMGDFNQQRPQDYTVHEWQTIAASATRRGVPREDGVAQILHDQHFRCVYDDVVVENNNHGKTTTVPCNWNPTTTTTGTTKTLPPSTHWSGTTIDYTYYCGGGSGGGHAGRLHQLLTPEGVYISPVGYSDHRMTVTDWTLQQHHRHRPTSNNNSDNDRTSNRNTVDAIVHEDDEEEEDEDTDTAGDHPARKTEKHDTKGSLFNGLPPNRHHAWHNIHILDQYQLPQREQYWHW